MTPPLSDRSDGDVATDEAFIAAAHDAFDAEYRANFPQGGDESDHYEATRCGIEAVITLTAKQTGEAP